MRAELRGMHLDLSMHQMQRQLQELWTVLSECRPVNCALLDLGCLLQYMFDHPLRRRGLLCLRSEDGWDQTGERRKGL